MNDYFNNQSDKMTKWIKLFLIMPSYQKIMLLDDSEDKELFEGDVSDVTFEDLTVFVEYELYDISAKNNVIVISVEKSES